MREIKFKAKATHNNEWYYGAYFEHINRQLCAFGDTLKDDDIEPIIITDRFADWNMPRALQRVDVNKNTVCQYTGLKDKNDNEIYEGDILIGTFYGFPVPEDNYIFNVYWDENTCGFQSNYFEPSKCEIIGNIHDEKGLMEVDNVIHKEASSHRSD